MDNTGALQRVASLLAYNSYRHLKAMRNVPSLQDNTEQALELNQQTAAALGIERDYADSLALLTGGQR